MFLSHFNRLHAHGDNDALLLKSPPAIPLLPSSRCSVYYVTDEV